MSLPHTSVATSASPRASRHRERREWTSRRIVATTGTGVLLFCLLSACLVSPILAILPALE